MGLFLNMFAVRSDSRDEVADSLISVLESPSYSLRDRQIGGEYTGQPEQYALVHSTGGWVQVFTYPEAFSDVVQKLSAELQSVAFFFMIYDGDFWQYELYDHGELRDKFWQIPDYFGTAEKQEREKWRGDSTVVSKLCNVESSVVAPYLRFAAEIDQDEKAHPDDEFAIASEWSMVDFQSRLGMKYPDFEKPDQLDLLMLNFAYANQNAFQPPRKPWWKFW